MTETHKDTRNNQAFEVDGRIWIKIDRELATNLGALILSTDTKNSALLALGHQLRSFSHVQNQNVETM